MGERRSFGTAALPLIGAIDQATNEGAGPHGIDVGPTGTQIIQVGKTQTTTHNGQPGVEITQNDIINLYVATPELMAHYGLDPAAVASSELLTSRSTLAGYELLGEQGPGPLPSVEHTTKLPTYVSDPTTLITEQEIKSLGYSTIPIGVLIQTPHSITTKQINGAEKTAAAVGLSVETRPTYASLSKLRTDSTAIGLLVALGVLAMAVGLMRTETANDLRTLAAVGASSAMRRELTSFTAGAVGFLAAILGTAGAYLSLIAWYHKHLHFLSNVPTTDLLLIVVGLPLVAAVAAWVLAGREPQNVGHRPLL